MKVIDVARWFCENNPQASANDSRGNVVVEKLCYYAQAMYLAVYNEPLFEEKILAWEKGPVVEEVYKTYKYNNSFIHEKSNSISNKEEEILKVINSVYGYKTPEELIESTHAETPWKQYEEVAKDRNNNPEIDIETMKQYYSGLKEVYEMNKDNEFENERLITINNCNFIYNITNIQEIKKYKKQLQLFARRQQFKSFNVMLDNSGELAIYE